MTHRSPAVAPTRSERACLAKPAVLKHAIEGEELDALAQLAARLTDG
jgi:hypothetical protein